MPHRVIVDKSPSNTLVCNGPYFLKTPFRSGGNREEYRDVLLKFRYYGVEARSFRSVGGTLFEETSSPSGKTRSLILIKSLKTYDALLRWSFNI